METTQGTNGKTTQAPGRIRLTPAPLVWWEEEETGEFRTVEKVGKDGKVESAQFPIYETLRGELVGRFEINRKGKIDHYFQIADATTGEVLSVNEKFDLRVLVPYCGTGKRYMVDITPLGKGSIGGGKTKWSYDVGITPIV